MQVDERLNRIAEFVRSRLDETALEDPSVQNDPEYRWQHILRVANYGKQVAEAEGAQVELVVAACLLHDVAHFTPGAGRDHGRLGAEIARPFLVELGYSTDEVENICYSVASHVDVENPQTLEAKVVSDADNIDRFGAYRIYQWCLNEIENFDGLAERLLPRLERLKGYRSRGDVLETPAGRELFNRQLDLQIAFFQALLLERKITVLPNLD